MISTRKGTLFTAFVFVVAVAGCADPSAGKPQATVNETPAMATAALGASPGEAGFPVYRFTNSASSLEFVGSKVTGSHECGFSEFSGTVTVPGEELTQARIEATIQMSSVFTDNGRLTEHLKSADFFDVQKFPETKLISTAIAKQDAGYNITADLTLHGVTKSITFPAQITLESGRLAAEAEFSINRFDFDIKYPGKPDDLIRENVLIRLRIDAETASSA